MSEIPPWVWFTLHLYGLAGMFIIMIAMLFGALYVRRHFAHERNPASDAVPPILEFYLSDETNAPPNETDVPPIEDHPLPNRARLGRCSAEELQEVADHISHIWCTRFAEEQERLLREKLEEQRIEEERELAEMERAREERERERD
ncbi:hypothetical protein LTR84_003460 [Exophiala bonariae]|uniref:Uncharacterized protein n=1 Tax=Exophiala bonariae TaxID=1690606 RepID=A0AAV9N715_9EURO|nr:hypothetical protein LTR84_003460 [Exophiala bonariae]